MKPGKELSENINIYNNNLEQSSNISMDIKVDNILLDSKKEEDIIFYHYNKTKLIKLNYEEKSVAGFSFLEYEMNSEDDKLVLDEKEIENIKTYHVLHVLKPKIELYLSYKNIEFNCTFMNNIYSYAEEIGFEHTIGYLLPLIQDLAEQKNKNTNILISFLNSFEKLLIYFKQFDTDHNIILNKLFPILSHILITNKEKSLLINKTVQSLKFLIDNITVDECLNNIVPILIRMANNENNELGQMIAIQIFSDKASILGAENIEVYILPMFESFSEGINEKLRLYCIQYMIPLFENINYEKIQTKFIKIYRSFSQNKQFQIRKMVCNLLPSVCKTILNNNNNYNPDKCRKKEDIISNDILEIFFNLIKKQEIENFALCIFGEFISYLSEETIISNPSLLNFFILKIQELLKYPSHYSKILYEIVYSFPSILFTYCHKIKNEKEIIKNWLLLKPIYIEFMKNKEFRIKNSIASSFGAVASFLNEKIFEKEICPLILDMFYNNRSNIQNAIIKVIPKVLEHVKNKKLKIEFFSIYKRGFNNIISEKTWREKICYIKGIKSMKDFFEINIVFNGLIGMLIEMCFDTFNIIRIKAAKTLSIFLLQFLSMEYKEENKDNNNNEKIKNYKKHCIEILNNFGLCKHYHYRQLFVYLCKKILTNEKIFKEYAFDLLNNLSYDKVHNTRYTLSSYLSKIIKKNKKEYEWITNDDKMKEIIYRLKNDKEIDVKKCVENIKISFENDTKKSLEKINVNDKFICEFKTFETIFEFTPFLGKNWLQGKK